MIKTYELVTDDGRDTGGRVSFKWKEVVGVQQLYKYDHRRSEDGNYEDIIEVVPGCCTIYVGRNEFHIKVNYDEIVNQLNEEEIVYK